MVEAGTNLKKTRPEMYQSPDGEQWARLAELSEVLQITPAKLWGHFTMILGDHDHLGLSLTLLDQSQGGAPVQVHVRASDKFPAGLELFVPWDWAQMILSFFKIISKSRKTKKA